MLLTGCASTMTNYKNYMESGKLGADLGAYTDDAFTFSLLFYWLDGYILHRTGCITTLYYRQFKYHQNWQAPKKAPITPKRAMLNQVYQVSRVLVITPSTHSIELPYHVVHSCYILPGTLPRGYTPMNGKRDSISKPVFPISTHWCLISVYSFFYPYLSLIESEPVF
jgi:hypothetical protein